MKKIIVCFFVLALLALAVTNPFPMGVVTMTGSNIKLSTGLSSFTGPTRIKTLILVNAGANTIYVGDSTLNTSSLAGVVLTIPTGGWRTIGGYAEKDNIDWGSFYVNGTSSDKLVVSGQTIN